MINKVILVGNLGQDPEVRHLENGSIVAKFSVATNERYKDKSGEMKTITEWHDVVVWRKLAEIAEKYLTKGKRVYIEGKLVHRKWQDADGNNRKTTEVVCNNFQMLDRREDESGIDHNFPSTNDEPLSSNPLNKINQKVGLENQNTKQDTSNENIDDDLPF